MGKFSEALDLHRREAAIAAQKKSDGQSEVVEDEVIEEIPQNKPELPPSKIVIRPLVKPKPILTENTQELSQEEITLMLQNLAVDEDVNLYLRVLRGEEKYNMAQKLNQSK